MPRETLEGAEGQRPAPAARRLRIRQSEDPAQHQEGHAGRRRARGSPRIATSSASSSTAPSSSACRARRRRRSRRRSGFAKEINPHTIQVSLAAPYPGTFLYKQARENNWLDRRGCRAVDRSRHADRAALLSASPHIRDLRFGRGVLQALLFPAVEDRVDRRRDGDEAREMMKRRLREGVEFFHFLRERRELAS